MCRKQQCRGSDRPGQRRGEPLAVVVVPAGEFHAGGGEVGLEAINTKVDPSVWDFYYLSVDLLADGFVFDGVILVSN